MLRALGRTTFKTLPKAGRYNQAVNLSTSSTARRYSKFFYGVAGIGIVTAASELYDYSKNTKRAASTPNPISALLSQAEQERKQRITSSVYNTVGVKISTDQVKVSFSEDVTEPTFYRGTFADDLVITLPQSMLYGSIDAEAQFVAACARQASYEKENLKAVRNILSGGFSGAALASARAYGLPAAVAMSTGFCAGLSLYLKYAADRRADKIAIKHFPDYEDELIHLIKNSQSYPERFAAYQKSRIDSLRANKEFYQQKYNSQYLDFMKLIQLHRARFDPINPEGKHQHPITRALKENRLSLGKRQKSGIERLANSARIYLPEDTERILKEFFELQKQQDTPLGRLYLSMTFNEFIERLITKTYKSVYLNGLTLHGRHHHEDRLMKALPKYPNADVKDNLALLRNTGTEKDSFEVYLDYLSLDEICVKSLIITQAVCLAVGDGRRDTEYSADSKSDTDFSIPVIKSLQAATRRPVAVASVSGIEARDGNSVHPDLFMIFSPEKPNSLWGEMAMAIKNSPLYQVSRSIYGEKLAIDGNPEIFRVDSDFILFGDGAYRDKWYICKPAYKERMKLLYHNLLGAADEQMHEYNLGRTYNLKGLGLGYFGFTQASSILEEISKEALYEVLSEIKLKHINRVNLVNWPSQIDAADFETPLQDQQHLEKIADIASVQVFEGIAEAFAEFNGSGDIGGTHACADAASQFGNEARIGMPPSSSDEAAIIYALLDSEPLVASENQDLPLRFKSITPDK